MSEYTVALVREGKKNLVIFFIETVAPSLNDEERKEILERFKRCASRAKMKGDVVAVWEFNGGVRFMAPPKWHDYLARFTFVELLSKATVQLVCD